jgi:hypothetical protein
MEKTNTPWGEKKERAEHNRQIVIRLKPYWQVTPGGEEYLQIIAQARKLQETSIQIPMAVSPDDDIFVTCFAGGKFEITWQYGEMRYQAAAQQLRDLYSMLEQYSTH